MRTFWLSSKKITVSVDVDKNDIIVEAAPVVRKFIGQPLCNLKRWMKKQGELRYCEIGGKSDYSRQR